MEYGGSIRDTEEESSKCFKLLYMLWKFCTCVFSHVTLVSLVVGYCVLGAFAFASLEAAHEIEVKRSIANIRGNVTEDLWEITCKVDVLIQENWTIHVIKKLKEFETDLLKKMKKEGWDGIEAEDNIQWTFAGALFYSIIVITTIGYGHIAPKTQSGKVVTIFYAILGIPLMLLCLSNIGDVMASSFRFLYWKVCCYVCTKPPRRRRGRNAARTCTVRQNAGRYPLQSPQHPAHPQPSTLAPTGVSTSVHRIASFRRSVRVSQKSADSGLGISDRLPSRTSYSDNESRYRCDDPADLRGFSNTTASPSAPPSIRPSTISRYSDIPVATPRPKAGRTNTGTASLDRRLMFDNSDLERLPVLFNKYALDPDDEPSIRGAQRRHDVDADDEEEEESSGRRIAGTRSLPRNLCEYPRNVPWNQRHRSQPPPDLRESVFAEEVDAFKDRSRLKRGHSYYAARPPQIRRQRDVPSPRIMSPMGFAVHRQLYVDDYEPEDDYEYYQTDDQDRAIIQRIKPVPIWLCVFLVVSYIFGGAFLFSEWEDWVFLDSAYFCFITLTTIGFGDFVPAHRLHAEKSIALCSLYLLFGIALLAMSFNLVQEEVINNVKSVAKRLGIIKENEDDDGD